MPPACLQMHFISCLSWWLDRLAHMLILLTCIQEVPSSILGWDHNYTIQTYLATFLVPLVTWWDLLDYLLILTPWSRVLLEKLIGFQLVKKFPAFCGTQRFITAFITACHLSLSWASSIQSMPPHPTSWRSILIFTQWDSATDLAEPLPSTSPTIHYLLTILPFDA
jgi:hypothetical protein